MPYKQLRTKTSKRQMTKGKIFPIEYRVPENSKERQNSLLTEENNRMGKTRDLFKKTGDNKGTFHAMDRNGKDLTDGGT